MNIFFKIFFILLLLYIPENLFCMQIKGAPPDTIYPKSKEWVIECRIMDIRGSTIFYTVNNESYTVDTSYVKKISGFTKKENTTAEKNVSAENPEKASASSDSIKQRYFLRILDLYSYQVNGTDTISLAGISKPRIMDGKKPLDIQDQKILLFVINNLSKGIKRIDYEGDPGNRKGYVVLNNYKLLNAELVGRGFAICNQRDNFSYRNDFKKLEQIARKNERGLWGDWAVISDEYIARNQARRSSREEKAGEEGQPQGDPGSMGSMLGVMKALVSPENNVLQGMLNQGKWKAGNLDNLDQSLKIMGMSKDEFSNTDALKLLEPTRKKKK